MSSNLDFLRTYFDEYSAGSPASAMEAAETYFSDDFQNLDKDGNVTMDRAGYLGFGRLMFAAFKDLKFVYSDLREDGEDVIVSGHFEGTHTGDLDLSAMGMGVVKASGKKIVWPDNDSKWKVEGDKIVSIQEVSGGLEEFFAPLGVKLPSA
jgi:predicted ester cyclase